MTVNTSDGPALRFSSRPLPGGIDLPPSATFIGTVAEGENGRWAVVVATAGRTFSVDVPAGCDLR